MDDFETSAFAFQMSAPSGLVRNCLGAGAMALSLIWTSCVVCAAQVPLESLEEMSQCRFT